MGTDTPEKARNRSFGQLHDANGRDVELEGIVTGTIIEAASPDYFQFSLAPYEGDHAVDISAYVIVKHQGGNSQGWGMRLRIAKAMGNRIYVKGVYAREESDGCLGEINATEVIIQQHS
jgi:hypothetical protein